MNIKSTVLVASLLVCACSSVSAQYPSILEQSKIVMKGDQIVAKLNCNTMNAQFSLSKDQHLQITKLAETRLACAGNAMKEDRQLSVFLMSKPSLIQEGKSYFLKAGNVKIPVIKEEAKNATDRGVIKFVYVKGEKKSCDAGIRKHMCLQIRNTEKEAWQLFYDDIEGFKPEPGYVYRLRIKEYSMEKQQDKGLIQDRSEKRWILDLIVEQKSVE